MGIESLQENHIEKHVRYEDWVKRLYYARIAMQHGEIETVLHEISAYFHVSESESMDWANKE